MIDYYEKQLFYNCMSYCKCFFTVLTLITEKQFVPKGLMKADLNDNIEAEIKHLHSCMDNIAITIEKIKER